MLETKIISIRIKKSNQVKNRQSHMVHQIHRIAPTMQTQLI